MSAAVPDLDVDDMIDVLATGADTCSVPASRFTARPRSADGGCWPTSTRDDELAAAGWCTTSPPAARCTTRTRHRRAAPCDGAGNGGRTVGCTCAKRYLVANDAATAPCSPATAWCRCAVSGEMTHDEAKAFLALRGHRRRDAAQADDSGKVEAWRYAIWTAGPPVARGHRSAASCSVRDEPRHPRWQSTRNRSLIGALYASL